MEQAWSVIMLTLAAAFPSLLLLLIIKAYAKWLWQKYFTEESVATPVDRRNAALKRSAEMASLWRTIVPLRAFEWSEHPSHVISALEHGWTAFAFSYPASAMGAFAGPVHQMWEMCISCASMKFCAPEITWIPGPGSGEYNYMQQIRFNPGLRSNKDGCVLPVQALQTALPLPGPVLGPSPFPQDAYFEICILASGNELSLEHGSLAGSERVKLIAESITSEVYDKKRQGLPTQQSHGAELSHIKVEGGELNRNNDVKKDALLESDHTPELDLHVQLGKVCPPSDQSNFENSFQKVLPIDWDQLLSVGLAGAEAPPFRLLGFDPGSVGFLSADGQCYVNGIPQLEGEEGMPLKGRPWGAVKTTIGCGFERHLKKVYFTVNGELVYAANLKSSEFSYPLYPTIASNYDVTISVNLGQKTFEYVPANIKRVANPSCRLVQGRLRKNGILFDDSHDLFSTGRTDAQWISEFEYANSPELQHQHVLSEAESDLFEIVLDGQQK